LIARVCREVKAQLGSRPVFASNSPAAHASATPFSVRPTSHQPVKRFSRFHWLWPWRTRIRLGKEALLDWRERHALARRVLFGKGLGPRRVERARLCLAPLQVLAQPGCQPFLARRGLAIFTHLQPLAVIGSRAQAALDIKALHANSARLPALL